MEMELCPTPNGEAGLVLHSCRLSGAWIDGGGCSVSINRPLPTELFACGLQGRARFKVRCAAWSAKLGRSGMEMELGPAPNREAGPVLHSCRPSGAWIDGGGCSVSINRPLLTELFASGEISPSV